MKRSSKLLTKLFGTKTSRPIPPVSPIDLPADGRLTEMWFQDLFQHCADIRINSFTIDHEHQQDQLILLACDGLTDTRQINEFVIPRLRKIAHLAPNELDTNTELDLTAIHQIEHIVSKVFSGQVILYFTRWNALYAYDVVNFPDRNPEESNTELSIKGPRDGFVENLTVNVALVRKRLRTNSLHYERFIVGRRTESRVALLYIKDFIRPELLTAARQRLQSIEIDSLLSSAQLEVILSDNSRSIFPLLSYTGRPDFVVDCLMHGRLAIIVDGAPMALIAPVNLTLLLKSPEDIYFPAYIVAFEMLFRLIGLTISLLLPGFWIALSAFNLEQVPFPLLATVVTTRMGLPLPASIEAFLMLGLFEIFREAGVRLPKAVGQTIAVVGGIIVGDAVIQAGLASTMMVIVAALTAVATFTLVNQTLSSAVTIVRFFVMGAASFLGMYGFIMITIFIVIYLSKLESFGIPYLAPLSPLSPRYVINALFKRPIPNDQKPYQYVLNETEPNQKDGSS